MFKENELRKTTKSCHLISSWQFCSKRKQRKQACNQIQESFESHLLQMNQFWDIWAIGSCNKWESRLFLSNEVSADVYGIGTCNAYAITEHLWRIQMIKTSRRLSAHLVGRFDTQCAGRHQNLLASTHFVECACGSACLVRRGYPCRSHQERGGWACSAGQIRNPGAGTPTCLLKSVHDCIQAWFGWVLRAGMWFWRWRAFGEETRCVGTRWEKYWFGLAMLTLTLEEFLYIA